MRYYSLISCSGFIVLLVSWDLVEVRIFNFEFWMHHTYILEIHTQFPSVSQATTKCKKPSKLIYFPDFSITNWRLTKDSLCSAKSIYGCS
jgi:hypothetical protein